MASTYFLRPLFSTNSQSSLPGKMDFVKRVRNYRACRIGSSRNRLQETKRIGVFCSAREGDKNQSHGEEPPESLFMKELKRRGMTPTSLLEDMNRSNLLEDEINLREEDKGSAKTNTVTNEIDKSLSNQRERSMALNSEGLEGLVPRSKLLLTLGGTFFLGFGPLILITVGFFAALYLYFGSAFVHDASNAPISPPPYIDPYELLEDERISQIASSLK